MMKSSVAINFIVLILLAAIALGLMIYLLKGIGSRGVESADMEKQRASLCLQYLRFDKDCDGIAEKNNGFNNLRQKLITLCENLKYCTKNDKACIHKCCNC